MSQQQAAHGWIDGRGNRARPGRGSGTAPRSPQPLANAARAIRYLHQNHAIGRSPSTVQPSPGPSVRHSNSNLGRAHPTVLLLGRCHVYTASLRTARPRCCSFSRLSMINAVARPVLVSQGGLAPASSLDDNWSWHRTCVACFESGQTI
jgi:hypothetical protein